jgi:transglutaminase-like putative cysteine protease
MTTSNYQFNLAVGLMTFLIVCISTGLTACGDSLPLIVSIDPRIGTPGETLTVLGKNFGETQGKSYITIADVLPTASSYIKWTDTEITLRLPEFGESALVSVQRGDKKSNALLIANRTTLPRPVSGPEVDKAPRIVSVEPHSALIGALVIIRGVNFGSSRDASGVFFTREKNPAFPDESPLWMEIFDTEFGYERWSDREIQARIPDGTSGGGLDVRTPGGISEPYFFETADKPGTKVFGDKQNYTLTYRVNIRTRETQAPNVLYLWFPRPVLSASQPSVRLISRTITPFIENYRGTVLFKINELPPQSVMELALSFRLDVYAVTTAVRESQIRQSGILPAAAVYTLPGPLIPSDHALIKSRAESVIGRERNPYLKARRIYDWLITQGGIQGEPVSGDVLEALDRKQTDPYGSALLFCALARAGGIPALPVSGVLIDRSGQAVRHYWAEFWIDGFGWIPVDPALGAGVLPDTVIPRENPEVFYFGNMDNRHIAFSRGQTVLSQIEVRGKTVIRERDFALQNIWEESSGVIDYDSQWGDVIITHIEN